MDEKEWRLKCIDAMKQAEYDQEFADGLAWLGREAIRKNVPIYDLMKEALIKHHQNMLQKTKPLKK